MTIHFDPAATDMAANSQSTPAPKPAPRSNARPSAAPAAKEAPKESPAIAPTIGTQALDITFRRDSNGRVFYVVTDPHSGNEIQELPPRDVRQVGERIEEYLKQQQAKAASRINVRG
jgi:hypothetical protein